MDIETHPFQPFLPPNAKVLMLGTFPPQPKRWAMEFYYPNFINDMWRIFGVVFFGDREHFVKGKSFDKEMIMDFCTDKGIALYDTATRIRRLKDNASDKFLEVVTQTDIPSILSRIPLCRAVVTTGTKATEIFAEQLHCDAPAMGESTAFNVDGRTLRLYRLPSSSRAYPLALEKKAAYYREMFSDTGLV